MWISVQSADTMRREQCRHIHSSFFPTCPRICKKSQLPDGSRDAPGCTRHLTDITLCESPPLASLHFYASVFLFSTAWIIHNSTPYNWALSEWWHWNVTAKFSFSEHLPFISEPSSLPSIYFPPLKMSLRSTRVALATTRHEFLIFSGSTDNIEDTNTQLWLLISLIYSSGWHSVPLWTNN